MFFKDLSYHTKSVYRLCGCVTFSLDIHCQWNEVLFIFTRIITSETGICSREDTFHIIINSRWHFHFSLSFILLNKSGKKVTVSVTVFRWKWPKGSGERKGSRVPMDWWALCGQISPLPLFCVNPWLPSPAVHCVWNNPKTSFVLTTNYSHCLCRFVLLTYCSLMRINNVRLYWHR